MRYIDAFNHFFPKRFFAGVLETPAGQKDMGKRIRGIPALFDLDERLRIVDSFPDYSQVLSLAMPAIDRLWGPEHAPEWARIGNDELAELVRQVSRTLSRLGRLAADECARRGGKARPSARSATAPTRSSCTPTSTARRSTRSISGRSTRSSRNPAGRSCCTRSAPARWPTTAPRQVSKYEICSVIGWPFETGAALARLVFSGIMDRYPDLKVITHHLGGIIPYFEGRVAHCWDQLGVRTSDEDYASCSSG